MKCFVTGAAGYIGSSLVKRLVNEGHEVTGLIHKHKPRNAEKKAKYVNGDITNINSVQPFLKNIDYVFHCAAFVKDYGPKQKFLEINLESTKKLAEACEKNGIKKFVFLSHIHYDINDKTSYYSQTKAMAEKYLLEKHKQNNFPVVIIRPGNVYGPGYAMWVIYPLKSIEKNRISLIDNGEGIFLHTYIDNLLDAIILVVNTEKAIGQTINITDGDNTITWGEYLNHLAKISGEDKIKRNMSKKTAMFIAKSMIFFNKTLRAKPWVTPMTVNIFTNQKKISIGQAESLLGYKPKINYNQGIKNVEQWLKKNHSFRK